MKTKTKKHKLIVHNDVVSLYGLGSLQRELGVSIDKIRAAVSAVGNHPDRISYYLRSTNIS